MIAGRLVIAASVGEHSHEVFLHCEPAVQRRS